MEGWVVYILECSDKSLYIGITNNLDNRIQEHNNGTGAKYTASRIPVRVLTNYKVENRSEASKMEAKLKLLSRKAKLKWIEENQSNSQSSN
jgi:putative endonuclease